MGLQRSHSNKELLIPVDNAHTVLVSSARAVINRPAATLLAAYCVFLESVTIFAEPGVSACRKAFFDRYAMAPRA